MAGIVNLATSGEINIEGVEKSFAQKDGAPFKVLDNVNLRFEAGSFTALVGPSGCGKSTLLRLIAGLVKADGGMVSLDGRPVSWPGHERGLVFQDPTLFPWKTVYENVAHGLRSRGVFQKEKKQIGAFINLVGLAGFEKSWPHELSGGMAQRAALARALVNSPKVLLLDESLGALDAFTRMNMQDEILRIWESIRQTVVMVTHDIDEAIYMANHIVVMSARPAKIECEINVEIGRPRRRDDGDFLELRSKILRILHFAGTRQEPQYYL
ncbi:MAG: ABC transporter ATP-binding protein [Spirochaetaceae bacterium]|jgi:ABC-type nitrate/sulfonate/bicarbonate transport system ATPase subunit|nr:ABC transporter ATP-binding protein [Spirochaetaceae bacterium]